MKVSARNSRRAAEDDEDWDMDDEEGAGSRKGSGWQRMLEAQEEFVQTVYRSVVDLSVHPKMSTRYQKKRAALLDGYREEMRKEAELLAKQKEGEMRAIMKERTENPRMMIQVEEAEKDRLLNDFNLDQDDTEDLANSIELSQKVAKITLDEVAETLRVHDWWVTCCDPVREVLLEVEGECGSRMSAPRPLTDTETVWEAMIGFQDAGVWNKVLQSASLAGKLLLNDMQQKDKLIGIRKRGGETLWQFPERFFGGVYCRSMRKTVGHQLKPLYNQHRNLVMAAVGYANATRERLMYHGAGRTEPTQFEGEETAANSVETRADRLVLGFFPWCKPTQLGTQANICTWPVFQRHIVAFADAYDAMWNKRPYVLGKDGKAYATGEKNCTWSYINEQLCVHKSLPNLETAIKEQLNLHHGAAVQSAKAKAKARRAKEEAKRVAAALAAMAARAEAAEASGGSEDEDGGADSDSESESDGSDSGDSLGGEEEPEAEEREETGSVPDAEPAQSVDQAGAEAVAFAGESALTGSESVPAADSGDGRIGRRTRSQVRAASASKASAPPTVAGSDGPGLLRSDRGEVAQEKPGSAAVAKAAESRPARATRSVTAGLAERQHIRAASLPLPKPAASVSLPVVPARCTRARAAQEKLVVDSAVHSVQVSEALRKSSTARCRAASRDGEVASASEGSAPTDVCSVSAGGGGVVSRARRAQESRSQGTVEQVGPEPKSKSNGSSGSKRAGAAGLKGKKAPKKRKKEKKKKKKKQTDSQKKVAADDSVGPVAMEEEEPDAAAAAKPKERQNKGLQEDTTDYTVRVLPEAPPDRETAFSVLYPKPGKRLEKLDVHGTLPKLIHSREAEEKTKFVCSLSKHLSGTFYSLGHVTTAPHQTHSSDETRTIQGAAADVGLQSMNLKGDMAFLHPDVSYLPPGTPEYTSLGLDETVGAVTPEVLSNIIQGICAYAKHGLISEQKAREMTGGLTRMVLNYGFGFGGHCYENGVKAALGEFADVAMMNMDSLDFFPDKGACLGVLFEALGKAQDAVVKELGLEDAERTDPIRNAECAGKVGELLQKPGCQAGDCLFLTIEGTGSEILSQALDRLNGKLRDNAVVTAVSTSMHVDPQNPCPVESTYPRVSLMTWVVHFVVEGETFSFQITGILCNRASLCNRKVNNESVKAIRENYAKGVANFEEAHGPVRYEDDGLGVFLQAAPLVVAHLEDEPVVSDKGGGKVGTWAGIEQVPPEDGSSPMEDQDPQYRLVQGKTVTWSLQTVGDQDLVRDRPAKAASDLADITEEGSDIPHGRMRKIKAIYNKMGQHSSERSAAEKVAKKFGLGEEHAWNLFYCKNMHYRSPAVFIAKCESLVNQWDSLWKSTPFGRKWLEAVEGNGFGGKLASAFMNMTVHAHSGNLTSLLKRETSSHIEKEVDFTPEFCSEQIKLLQEFANDVRSATHKVTTLELLEKAGKPSGTLGRIKGFGQFGYPTLITGLFLWGLADIPPWRAAECPILDASKKHYQKGGNAALHQAILDQEKVSKVKNLAAVHRAMLIVAHIEGVAQLTVENGACEGVRQNEVFDLLLENMDSFDLRPTEDSHAYSPKYELWHKPYGEDAKWAPVPLSDVRKVLRIV